MRRYEQIYILRPSLSEDEITTITQNTNFIIEGEGGSVIFLNKWGMKKLAYPIKKELQGYYVFCDFAATPAAVSEMERKFRIDDSVLKYLTVKLSDSISPEEITAAQEEAAVKSVQQQETAEDNSDENADDAGDAGEKETASEDAE